jgi:predicted RNase H-like HicB family nuclease
MLFPVVFHKDKGSAYGVTIPDIPGCFSAGDTLEEAIHNIQEAVECHIEPTDEIPAPSPLEALISDPAYKDGAWVMVDIDLSFMRGKTVRVNITVPENILRQIDAAAKNKGLSRSEYLVNSARKIGMG